MYEVERNDETLILETVHETTKKKEHVRLIIPLAGDDSEQELDRLTRLMVKSAADYYNSQCLH